MYNVYFEHKTYEQDLQRYHIKLSFMSGFPSLGESLLVESNGPFVSNLLDISLLDPRETEMGSALLVKT